jgi:hypothetical protein
MSDSPIAATPYEVLGVSPSASEDELRHAYRRMLRDAHPDTGGSEARFHAVQLAWDRIGTPERRAAYDRGRPSVSHGSNDSGSSWTTQPTRKPRDSRPLARSYGHPGGWNRERYLTSVREWAGRGTTIADPYDPALVRTAPLYIRHLLADALAEEATARQLTDLGIAYTIWHDLETDIAEPNSAQKLDHVVLGPSGLFAMLSEDWGGLVQVRKGDLIGDTLGPGERPMHALSLRARYIARAARVKFTALVIVVPDGGSDDSLMPVGRLRGVPTMLVQHSRLPDLLRSGLAGATPVGGNELFDVRTRLQAAARFV